VDAVQPDPGRLRYAHPVERGAHDLDDQVVLAAVQLIGALPLHLDACARGVGQRRFHLVMQVEREAQAVEAGAETGAGRRYPDDDATRMCHSSPEPRCHRFPRYPRATWPSPADLVRGAARAHPGPGRLVRGPVRGSCGTIRRARARLPRRGRRRGSWWAPARPRSPSRGPRSEEHTSELQSREKLVCRLLLEKKKVYYKACAKSL